MAIAEKIIILDFGGQYNQLIARRIREAGVFCEILNYAEPIAKWRDDTLKGIILTGGPNSVYEEGAPRLGHMIFLQCHFHKIEKIIIFHLQAGKIDTDGEG